MKRKLFQNIPSGLANLSGPADACPATFGHPRGWAWPQSQPLTSIVSSIALLSQAPSVAFLAVLFGASIATGQTILIGGDIRNGNFEATEEGASDDGDRPFADTAEWTNVQLTRTQNDQATRNNPANLVSSDQYPGASGGYNAVVAQDDFRWFGMDTGHSVGATDSFSLQYHWVDAFNWNDASDQIAFVFYTTTDDEILGAVENRFEILSGVSTLNATYEKFSQSGISLPASFVGKKLFINFHGRDGDGNPAGSFARLDDLELILEGGGQKALEITSFKIDSLTSEITLRWTNTGSSSYTIEGDDDLDFSSGSRDVYLDGSEDATTHPGEIEFTFTDPSGGALRFWRVSKGS